MGRRPAQEDGLIAVYSIYECPRSVVSRKAQTSRSNETKDTETGHITATGGDHAQAIVQPLIGAVEDSTHACMVFCGKTGGQGAGGRNGGSGIFVRFEE